MIITENQYIIPTIDKSGKICIYIVLKSMKVNIKKKQ